MPYSLDRLVANEKRLFGWGWVVHPEMPIESVRMRVEGEGWQTVITTDYGLVRADVGEAFPDLAAAGSSGFVVTGFLPGQPIHRLTLEVQLADGSVAEIPATDALETRYGGQRLVREASWLAKAVLRRLLRGDIRGILSRARAQNFTALSLDDAGIASELLPKLKQAREILVVLDHNMGGGANHYRRLLIERSVAEGKTVLLCVNNLPTLDYRLHLYRPGAKEDIYRVSSFLALESLIDKLRVREIFLNSPVSYDEPLHLAEWLAGIRASRKDIRLTVCAHEYITVCPSFVLLDADVRYCGVPSIAECNACLPRNKARYVALAPPTEIGAWRSIWGRCLAAADEIRCFSDSTRRILTRVFPDVGAERFTVVPHVVDYRPARRPVLDHAAPLVIGVLGQISLQKGAGIVADLVESLDRRNLPIRVVVLGTLDRTVHSDRLTVAGPYEREQLADLIEAHHINMFLFPSICPETFSYVTEEMILLDLPIVAFDLGAPADRLARYGKGRICGTVDAAAALETMLDFHAELSAHGGESASPGHATSAAETTH